MRDYNFHAQRIFNMDEMGITSGKDTTGTKRKAIPRGVVCVLSNRVLSLRIATE